MVNIFKIILIVIISDMSYHNKDDVEDMKIHKSCNV